MNKIRLRGSRYKPNSSINNDMLYSIQNRCSLLEGSGRFKWSIETKTFTVVKTTIPHFNAKIVFISKYNKI